MCSQLLWGSKQGLSLLQLGVCMQQGLYHPTSALFLNTFPKPLLIATIRHHPGLFKIMPLLICFYVPFLLTAWGSDSSFCLDFKRWVLNLQNKYCVFSPLSHIFLTSSLFSIRKTFCTTCFESSLDILHAPAV